MVKKVSGLSLIAALICAGCVTHPVREPVPAIPVPNQFKLAKAMRAELEPGGAGKASAPAGAKALAGAELAAWWRTLANTELDALVDRAIANNTDLRISTLRIAQSKARADQADADRYPTISLPYQAKGEGPAGGIGSLAPGESSKTRHTYQLSLRADWRVDLWGENSALAESAQMKLLRSTYDRDNTRRLLVGNIATLYVEYLSLNDRIRVARETEVVLRDMLASVSRRVEVGDATVTDMEQQRTAVYAVQATIPALELQRETISNALAQLLGVPPVSLALSSNGLDSLKFSGALPGVPASLILHRPDIRVVEARLLSANADIEVARARLLPPLDLTAQVGYGSFVLSRLFQSHTLFWNAIANLSATLFDHGKRASEIDFSRAVHEELVETYVTTIYNAIRETEDAIATVQMTGKRIEAQQAATEAAKRAWDFSAEAYAAGAIDYLTLIDTQRTYHRSLDELLRIRMEQMKGVMTMFSALGGGSDAHEELPAAFATAAEDLEPVPDGKDEERWHVELVGLHDRAGLAHAWRDLTRRFPELMRGHKPMPKLAGQVGPEDNLRAAWYRLFIVDFSSEEDARNFCDKLMAQLQRCSTIAASTVGKGSPVPPTAAARRAAVGETLSGWRFDDLLMPLPLLQADSLSGLLQPLVVSPTIPIDLPREFLPALVVPQSITPDPKSQ